MFNLLISSKDRAWEEEVCTIPIERFYVRVAKEWGIDKDKIDTLRQLEKIPTLLMYEGGIVSGPNAKVIRHGRLQNIGRQGDNLTFEFEPDTEKAYFNRRYILKYKDSFGLGRFGFDHTQWVVLDGDLPSKLLDNAVATLPIRATFKIRFALKRLHLSNFLSYGPNAEPVELKQLNVLIGPNGSGKSNFLEAFALLQDAPNNKSRPIATGGGVRKWIYRRELSLGNPEPARLEVIIDGSPGSLRYVLAFDEIGERFELMDELLEDEGQQFPYDDIYYKWNGGYPIINAGGEYRNLPISSIKPDLSILAQKKDNDLYEVLTEVAERFCQIKLYREWTFGPSSKLRSQIRSDLPNIDLETDASNLGLILNGLRRDYDNYQKFMESLKILYPGIKDVDIRVGDGNVQIFLQENNGPIPASRLSDGTLRYLFLLTILYDPNPPPIICIEEPELGLHPDVLPTLARLLHEASERTQLIVTTHSPILIDALSETPESILVCEQTDEGSTIKRLDADELKPWLEKYRLGQLWMSGHLGGTRW